MQHTLINHTFGELLSHIRRHVYFDGSWGSALFIVVTFLAGLVFHYFVDNCNVSNFQLSETSYTTHLVICRQVSPGGTKVGKGKGY